MGYKGEEGGVKVIVPLTLPYGRFFSDPAFNRYMTCDEQTGGTGREQESVDPPERG
jgi:hypothetical protein